MRSASIFLALAMMMAATLPFFSNPVGAVDPPKLSITVEAGVGANFVFNPATIILPQVPIVLNVTLFNNGTGAANAPHTFTIRDGSSAFRVDIQAAAHGDRVSVEFTVATPNTIVLRGLSFQAEASAAGGIKFFCKPHESLNMVGNIVVGGTTTAAGPEIGVFLRAYWIGLIGLAAMLVWTGIAYFIIKSSSRHLRDHHDHIRRGLP